MLSNTIKMANDLKTSRKKIVIDTDCGVDDAQAILCALSKEYEDYVEVIGVTCVAGNVGVDQVCVNVLKVLEVANKTDIPVYKGAYKPLLAHNFDASYYHGKDGLGDATGIAQPDVTLLNDEHAVDFLVRIVKENPGEVSIVAIGPLTNLALACQMDPAFGQNVKKCHIMGGNTEAKGNIAVCSEFNFYFDPEAAFIVLDEVSSPVEILTWEFCMKSTLDPSFVSDYMNQNTPKGEFVKKISAGTLEFHEAGHLGIPKDYVLCDQFAVALAMQPDLILKEANVFATVELQGQHTRGQMVIDWRRVLKKENNISVVVEVDMVKFRSLVIKSLQ